MLKKRALLLLSVCVLILGSALGGTVAWLSGETVPVTNVFSTAGLSITLSETDTGDPDPDPTTNTYPLAPGALIRKDPVVGVHAGSEEAWVFVVLQKSENFDRFMQYEIADGWNELADAPGTYYRAVPSKDVDQLFSVLKDDAVSVLPSVTSGMLHRLTPENFPTLTISAYAIQQEGIALPNTAWTLLSE